MENSSTLSPVKQTLLQRRLKGGLPGQVRPPDLIPARPNRDSAPLSFTQRQMWVIDQMAPGNPAYNLPYAYRLRGALDVMALEDSFNEIIKRHETLRTTFTVDDGEPLQVIHPDLRIKITVTALDHLSREEREDTVQALASEESVKPFDLSRLPLIRVSLFTLTNTEHVLITNLHHIVADGLSIGILFNELDALYRRFTGRGSPPLHDMEVQYGDFALWQRQTVANEGAYSKQIEFWRKQLDGRLPVLELPGDKSRPAVQSFKGSNVFFDIPADQVHELKSLAAREGCTFFMTVLTAFQTLLHRYTGAEDLIIGTPVASRTPCEIEPLIGLFLNMVALRCDLSANPSFLELLRRTRDTVFDTFSNADLPFAAMMKHLKFERDTSRNPVFQVALQVLSKTTPRLGDLEVSSFYFDLKFAQFDLTLHLYEEPGGYRGRFEYCTDLFHRETIERWSQNFLHLLEVVAQDPQQTISRLPVITDSEREQVLEAWNQTAVDYPAARCVHEMVEEQARTRPHALAAESGGRKLSYSELNERAERLAERLRSHGVQRNSLVAIYLERSTEMLVALLAVWKAGGAYAPIDTDYPPERVRYILEDTKAVVMLTQRSFSSALPVSKAAILRLDDEEDWLISSSPGRSAASSPEQLAYVIYTSGSTGRPKGVPITHANLFNLICWHQQAYGVTPADRATQIAGPAFDASVWEVWPYLTAGASLHIPDESTRLDAGRLVRWLAEQQISLTFLPTPLAESVLREDWPQTTPLRVLLTGGDRLKSGPTRKLPFRVVNHYGPTENTVVSTCADVQQQGTSSAAPSIGRPLPNTRAYIVDRHLQPVPIGIPGELLVGGAQLTSGYWNQAELTAEKFIPNPFSADSASRLYKTGDLVRWLPDGNIEFRDRIDNQVKIRGFRIELGEIESTLCRHPAVRETVVLAQHDLTGEKRLIAYIVAENAPVDLGAELRTLLRAILPEYMVPGAFVFLDAFPLTPNGKIDRNRLPAPERSRSHSTYVVPRTPMEDIVAGMWSEILGLDRVGVEDNFFDLGGNSLLAMRVISRIRQALAVELPLRQLFASPTVSRMAAHIEALRAGSGPTLAFPALQAAAESGPAKLSFSQQRLWFLDQIEPQGTAYIIPAAFELRGSLNLAVLERALNALVSRHDSLRTTFVDSDSGPLQVVSDPRSWSLPVTDLSGNAQSREQWSTLLRQEASRGFDLTRGPLFRAKLYRLAPDTHVLLLVMHHIVSDGWSMGILIRELGELYRSFLQGQASPLPVLRVQYRDFARWQRNWLQGEILERLLSHWRTRLAGASQVLELPVDRFRPAMESHRGGIYAFTLPLELTEALRAFGQREGATLYMTLLSGFMMLLSRYSGQRDLLVGTPVANRNHAEIEDVVGFFINTLVLRGDLSSDPSAREFLARMREVCLDAFAHQDLPFERLVEEMRPARDLGRNPLVQVMFAMQNLPLHGLDLPGITLTPVDVDPRVAQVDLTLQAQETAQGLSASIEYATDLFERSTIARMALHWRSLLEAMVASPERRVSELTLLTEGERRQLLVDWNDTGAEYPCNSGVHELFEKQVEQTPDSIAITSGDQHLTYAELNCRSNQLAHHLRKLGVGPNVLVGICVERSLEMVAGLFGILKTGAAYLPLDPAYPKERLAFMIEDSGAGIVVTQKNLATGLEGMAVNRVLLDEPLAGGIEIGTCTTQPENPAYVIYTSGSTGKPKGVVIPHRAVANFLSSMAREPGLTASDVLVAVTTLSFDIAVLELLLPLTHGATVVIATRDETVDGHALSCLLERHSATVMQATPTTWRLLLEAGWTPRTGFKALVGGETMPKDLADELIGHGVELWNMYGPTETTVWSTCARISDTSNGITIGKPIANTTVRILDARKSPCPIGVPGELCIGGDGLAIGYWNQPDLTAERFIPDPFSTTAGARLYRTGDRARWRDDGMIEHLGRLDFQVKIRGFRIELGEIESALSQHAAVREVVVLAREDVPGEKRLVAYVVAEKAPADLANQLRALVHSTLPEYMVPAQFVMLQAMPRTPNGKLDRNALPAPTAEDQSIRAVAVPPQTPTEEMVLGIFRGVLDRNDFGPFDNFFDLGGHSLMAARLMSRLRTESGVDLPLRDLFSRPTVAGLAEAIDARQWLEKSTAPASNVTLREEIVL